MPDSEATASALDTTLVRMPAEAPAPLDAHAATAATARKAPVRARWKFAYGAGALVDGISNGALTYFLLFYLTSVCGLSGTAAGSALLLGLVADAVIDPAIGLISDHTRSRTGRRHPYLLYSILPVAVLFGVLFSIPAALHGVALLAFVTTCAMALRIGLSIFNLPYVSVGAEVTDDYAERSSIVAYRICFSMLGTFLVIGLGLGVFMSGETGLLNREAYIPFAWVCAVLMVAGGLAATRATRIALHRLHVAPATTEGGHARILAQISEMLRNRSFLILFAVVVSFCVAQGVAGALALYLNRYFWNLSATEMQLVLVGATLGPFIGAPAIALLGRRFEKKTLTICALLLFAVSQLWPVAARLAGALTIDGGALTGVLVANAILGGAALVGAAIGGQSMMADATDEHEFLFGVRREGLFFSGLTLAVKAAVGLGGFLAGLALDWIHFPSASVASGDVVALPTLTVAHLGLAAGAFPALITILAPLALIAYRLDRARHRAILMELDARRGHPVG